jgi:hypothetical protein
VNYNSSSSYNMCSMSHDPAAGSSTRAARFPLTHMWGSHQFHPYNTHCQELVEDQRSKLINEDAAWYSEIILHAEPKAEDPSHPKVQQPSSSVRFFL